MFFSPQSILTKNDIIDAFTPKFHQPPPPSQEKKQQHHHQQQQQEWRETWSPQQKVLYLIENYPEQYAAKVECDKKLGGINVLEMAQITSDAYNSVVANNQLSSRDVPKLSLSDKDGYLSHLERPCHNQYPHKTGFEKMLELLNALDHVPTEAMRLVISSKLKNSEEILYQSEVVIEVNPKENKGGWGAAAVPAPSSAPAAAKEGSADVSSDATAGRPTLYRHLNRFLGTIAPGADITEEQVRHIMEMLENDRIDQVTIPRISRRGIILMFLSTYNMPLITLPRGIQLLLNQHYPIQGNKGGNSNVTTSTVSLTHGKLRRHAISLNDLGYLGNLYDLSRTGVASRDVLKAIKKCIPPPFVASTTTTAAAALAAGVVVQPAGKKLSLNIHFTGVSHFYNISLMAFFAEHFLGSKNIIECCKQERKEHDLAKVLLHTLGLKDKWLEGHRVITSSSSSSSIAATTTTAATTTDGAAAAAVGGGAFSSVNFIPMRLCEDVFSVTDRRIAASKTRPMNYQAWKLFDSMLTPPPHASATAAAVAGTGLSSSSLYSYDYVSFLDASHLSLPNILWLFSVRNTVSLFESGPILHLPRSDHSLAPLHSKIQNAFRCGFAAAYAHMIYACIRPILGDYTMCLCNLTNAAAAAAAVAFDDVGGSNKCSKAPAAPPAGERVGPASSSNKTISYLPTSLLVALRSKGGGGGEKEWEKFSTTTTSNCSSSGGGGGVAVAATTDNAAAAAVAASVYINYSKLNRIIRNRPLNPVTLCINAVRVRLVHQHHYTVPAHLPVIDAIPANLNKTKSSTTVVAAATAAAVDNGSPNPPFWKLPKFMGMATCPQICRYTVVAADADDTVTGPHTSDVTEKQEEKKTSPPSPPPPILSPAGLTAADKLVTLNHYLLCVKTVEPSPPLPLQPPNSASSGEHKQMKRKRITNEAAAAVVVSTVKKGRWCL